MLKKLATIIMTGALFLAPFQTVNAAPNYFVTLDGVKQNVTPIVQDGTTLLPVATVGKLIGYQATWDNKTKSGTLEKGSINAKFKLGSRNLDLNEDGYHYLCTMSQPVKIINGKAYLPLRSVGEVLYIKVGYNGSTGEISLQTEAYRDKQKYNPKYDNLTIEEYDNLSLEEYQMMTKAQRDKMEKKILDEYNNKDTEQENNDTEQPKEEEISSTSEPKTEEKIEYSDEEIVEETLRLLNEERERLGLNSLTMKQEYNDFAKWKANYLVEHDMFRAGITGSERHEPNGKTIKEQMTEYGINNFKNVGENIFRSYSIRIEKNHAFNFWKNSPIHYKNMIHKPYTSIGIGISDKGNVIVMNLVID